MPLLFELTQSLIPLFKSPFPTLSLNSCAAQPDHDVDWRDENGLQVPIRPWLPSAE